MRSNGQHRRRGLSLIESLMLVAILSIVATGAGQSLLAITKIPVQTDAALDDENVLVSKMEQVRSAAFDSLTIGTAIAPYSEGDILVDVAYADPGGGGSSNTNWKQVTVRQAGGRQLIIMVCKP
jgi:type II secretory pathway pseudopilin PulG